MRKKNRAFTVWFTGLPCSGKTTLANGLAKALKKRGILCDVIDGDVIRRGWCSDLSYTKRDREANIKRAARLAKMLNEAGVTALIALVSPYRRARAQARRQIAPYCFVEVFLDCPSRVCRLRDTKGFYSLAAAGKIKGFTGFSALYEQPLQPEVVIKTSRSSIAGCMASLTRALKKQRLL